MAESIILEFKAPERTSTTRSTDPRDRHGDRRGRLGAAAAEPHRRDYGRRRPCRVRDLESKAAQEAFMARLGPALAEVGIAPPVRMEWFDVVGHYHQHSH